MSDPSADPYLAERIRTALAQDSRLNELGIQVSLVGNRVFVTGTVATEDRLRAVALVIAERFPELDLQNDVTVQHVGASPVRETLS